MARVTSGPIIEFPIAKESASPLYIQLVDHIRELIISGKLAPNKRLPSTRQMASELRISRNTVVEAFDQLIAEGYILSRHGSGTFVTEAVPDNVLKTKSLESPVGSKDVLARSAHISKNAQRLINKTRVIVGKRPAFSRQPDVTIFPFEVWSELFMRVWKHHRVEQLNTQDSFGYPPFREAIAEHLASWRGVTCSPEQIMVTAGTTHAMHFLTRLLLEPGDDCWVENPGFIEAKSAINSVHARAVPVPCDNQGLRVQDARKIAPNAKVAFVTPSHHHPFGMILSDERRVELREWAKKSGAWIIEDDHDSEIRHSGLPSPTLKSYDQTDSVIYVCTFSKVTFQTIRLGFIVFPQRLISPAKRYRALTEVCPPISMQPVMEKFIRQGHFATHLRRARKLYCDKKALFMETATKALSADHTLVDDNVGTHLVLKISDECAALASDAELSRILWSKGIQATPLSEYYIGKPQQQGFLLGYGALDPEEMEYPLRVLNRTLNIRA